MLFLLTAAKKQGNIAADSRHFVPSLVDMQNQVLLEYIPTWKLIYFFKIKGLKTKSLFQMVPFQGIC